MPHKPPVDYETLRPKRGARPEDGSAVSSEAHGLSKSGWPGDEAGRRQRRHHSDPQHHASQVAAPPRDESPQTISNASQVAASIAAQGAAAVAARTPAAPAVSIVPAAGSAEPHPLLKRGHALSFLGLLLFTAALAFRPYEYFPSLSAFSTIAFWLALFTLIVFAPTQLGLEGTLTARPREVNLVLLFCLLGLISVPVAHNPQEAWATFSDVFLKAIAMFIVMINVVRTERRLKILLLLAIAHSFLLSLNAFNDYRLGLFKVEGYRVQGSIGGMFGNPNDMALHLVTILPIAVALLFSTRNPFGKVIYGATAGLMIIATVLTYSRGGFLGLIAVGAVLGWKFGRRNRAAVIVLGLIVGVLFIALAPGNYGSRLTTILNTSSEGSATQRREILIRSIIVALANPIFGVGMGNFHTFSIKELVSHNSFTQVAAEMGMAAMVVYILFIITPFKRLREIERETLAADSRSRLYYLAVGLQASLIGYMVSSFFLSVAYQWFIYYLVGYAVALRRIYESGLQQDTPTLSTAEANQEGQTAGYPAAGSPKDQGHATIFHQPEIAHR